MKYPEQARTADSDLYHWVTFRPGPKIGVETATCGLAARYWPRIGVRMTDQTCQACIDVLAEREAEARVNRGDFGQD